MSSSVPVRSTPTRNGPARWRLLVGLVALALALTSCTPVEEDTPTDAGGTGASPVTPAADDPTTDGAPDDATDGATNPPLQDLWLFTRMQTVDQRGDRTDVVVALLEELDELAQAPIALTPELSFRPVPQLNARIDRVDGRQRAGVRAIAGLFEVTEAAADLDVVDDGIGSALGVIASADAEVVHVAPGDQLSLDLFDLQTLAAEDMVLIDYVFGQTVPATDGAASEPVGDDLALLAARFADGQVAFGAPESDLGGDVAVIEGVPMQRTSTLPSPTPAASRLAPSGPHRVAPTPTLAAGVAAGSAAVAPVAIATPTTSTTASTTTSTTAGVAAGSAAVAPIVHPVAAPAERLRDGVRTVQAGDSARPTDAGNSARPLEAGNSARPLEAGDWARPLEAGNLTRTVQDGGGGGSIPIKARGPIAGAIGGAIFCAGVGWVAGPVAGVAVTVVCTAITAVGAFGTLRDLLDRNDPPNPPRPCRPGAVCTTSSADPHLVGFDGQRFSVHAAGEFTAVRNDALEVEIQVRMVPVGPSVAANGAVATRVGDVLVQVDATDGDPVRLDGEPSGLAEYDERALPDGGSVHRYGASVEVRWPDGTALWVEQRSFWLLDYQVVPAPDWSAADVTGLHGTLDGRRLLADGTELSAEPDHVALMDLVEGWRISDATSLFTYAPGMGTASYTDRDFPQEQPDLDRLDADARERARTVCAAAGLADDDLRECMIDVGSTGDLRYVWSAIEHQVMHHPERFPRRVLGADQDAGPVMTSRPPWAVTAHELGGTRSALTAAGDEQLVLTHRCPPTTDPVVSTVWGSDPYTSDSSVCAAATHAGVITADGGDVEFVVGPGEDSYEGSTRNGVTTRPWGSWSASFSFVGPTP